jgi:hypothetical protein
MIRIRCASGSACSGWKGLLAVLALSFMPSVAAAAKITFRNDTNGPIIVQGTSIVRGVVLQGKRHVLQPGQSGSDNILVPGQKLIRVYDANRPTQVLGSKIILCDGTADLLFGIETNTPDPKEKPSKTPIPKVKLVQDTSPMKSPSSRSPRR